MHKIQTIVLLIIVFSTVILTTQCIAVEKRVLSNGMVLITEEDHSRELVSILTYVDGGARTETPELSGLSHYFEHLIFRGGTSKQAELEMRREFLALGKFYGYTFEDGTCYYIVVPRDNLPEALERYSDVLLNLKLTKKKVETERGIVLEEFSQSYFDVPFGMAYYNLYQTAYTTHPYGQTVIGDSAVVRKATMDIFEKFYRERYTPDNFIMTAVGDFDTEELTAEIEKTFGNHSGGGRNFEMGKVEPPQDNFRFVSHRMPVNTAHFTLGFHIPAYSAPEFPAVEVFNQALAGNSDRGLNRKLAREKGLFHYIGSWIDRTKDPGLWVIYGALGPDRLDNAFTALFEELGNIAGSGISAAELSAAKRELIRDYKSSRESFFRRSESLCYYELTSNLALEGLYEQIICGLEPSYVDAQARRFIRTENMTLSLVIPQDTEAPDPAPWAEKARVKAPQSPTTAADKSSVEEIRLKNGAVILMNPIPSAQTAAMEIVVRGGLWSEPSGKEGIAGFLCRMLTKGTLDIEGAEFSRMTGELGLQIGAEASWDYSRMRLQSTSGAFERGVELTALAFTRPGFRADDIETARREILTEIASMEDKTYDYTRQEFNRLLYQNNPYSRPTLGFAESVEKISAEDLERFHQDNFSGENIIIAVAGNFNRVNIKNLIIELFGEIKIGEITRGKLAGISPAREPAKKQDAVKIIPKDRAQTTYNLGWTAPPANHKDYLPMVLARNMLSSRMFFRFVYEEGICYRMWTRYSDNLGPGKFWFETGISPDNYIFSRDEALKEFYGFLKEPITSKMLSQAKSETIQKMKLETETPQDRAFVLAKYYLLGLGPDFIDTIGDKLEPLTAKRVKKTARKYLKKDGYTLLVVGKTEPK